MPPRPVMIASLLGASIGVPYVASRATNDASQAPDATPAAVASEESPPNAKLASTPVALPSAPTSPSSEPLLPPSSSSVNASGVRIHPVEQVFRFDLTKDWVYRSWDHVMTGPTDVGLFALRVPLVSGTSVSSLAGSLTYYFNSYGQIEHISFLGRTGDPTRLVQFLMKTYEFRPAAAPTGEQLLQVTRRNRVHSELRTRAASSVDTTSPLGHVAVELELARPGTRRFLPPRMPQLVVPPAEPAAAPAETAEAERESYFDKVRFATPQEEGQVLWKRWPN